MIPLGIKAEHEILQDLEISEMSPQRLNQMLESPEKTCIGLGFKNTEKDEKPKLILLEGSDLQRFCLICDVDQYIWGTTHHYISYHCTLSRHNLFILALSVGNGFLLKMI